MSPRHVLPPWHRARHARSQRTHRVAKGLAVAATAVMAFGVGGVATAYRNLESNIDVGSADALIATRPAKATPTNPTDEQAGQPLNFVLIGSDVRDGENAEIGGSFAGMRSDTTIVMHISADRSRIEMVSIPRDSMVQLPDCVMTNGRTTKGGLDQFNAAFAYGADHGGDVTSAAACTQATVEATTGIYIDGYFVVDFVGFISMVDALGGVEVCVPNDMRAPKAELDVVAGQQTFDGRTALAYARARTGSGVGDGSDLTRIKRQQQLLGATVNEVLSKNLLTQQVDLYRFLDAATLSLAADEKWASLPTLAGLAYSLRSIRGGNITFMTIPVEAYPADHNRVQWRADAQEIWDRIAQDVPVVDRAPEPEPSATGGPSGEPTGDATDEPTPTPTSTGPSVDAITPDDIADDC